MLIGTVMLSDDHDKLGSANTRPGLRGHDIHHSLVRM